MIKNYIEQKSVILARLKRWAVKGGLAILDQGFFSGSNFILNILLARWLDSVQYGAFAIGFAVYLFLSGLHNALILEPISVFGTSKHYGRLKGYLASQILFHFFVTSGIGLLVVLLTFALFFFDMINQPIFQSLMGVGLFLPFMLSIWLARRIHYAFQNPAGSLQTTLFYFILLSVLTVSIYLTPVRNNLFFWFGAMGVAGILGSANISRYALNHDESSNWRLHLREQWVFGRWIVFATFLHFIGSQIQLFLIAFFGGLDDAGAFRATQNLMLPMLQVLAAFSVLAMPTVSLEFGHGDFSAMKRKSFRISFALIGVALCYELALFFGADWLERFLYGGKYAGISWLFPVIGLVALINALEMGYSMVLRSLQKPSFYIIDKAIFAVVGGISAFVLVNFWAVAGAVISLVVAECFVLATYVWLYRRWFLSMAKG